MPIWTYCYLIFMCMILPYGIYENIKNRKSFIYLATEFAFTITAFTIFISFWNKNISSLIGAGVVPLTLFVIIWGCYSGIVTIKQSKSELNEIKGFRIDLFILSQLLIAPIYVVAILKSAEILNS